MVDRLLPEQLAYESDVLSGFGEPARAGLAAHLSDLLLQWEGRLGTQRR